MARRRTRTLNPRSEQHGLIRPIVDSFVEHNLLTYAAAIAFQGLVALIPLAMLALGLLGAFGLEQVWRDDVAPKLRGQFCPTSTAGSMRRRGRSSPTAPRA